VAQNGQLNAEVIVSLLFGTTRFPFLLSVCLGRLAAKQRSLLAVMEEAHEYYLAQLQAEQCEIAEREALDRWAEFEVYDVAEKEKRFTAWRVSCSSRA
jgi:hypothetical protein